MNGIGTSRYCQTINHRLAGARVAGKGRVSVKGLEEQLSFS